MIAYPHRISVAPMMDYTDRHCRYFLRQFTRRTLLYTEMITTQAILLGPRDRLLAYHPMEHPLALQLGGSDPNDLATCARIAESLGYDEINLNVGCPSDRVQSGAFGLCLMKTPHLVAECVSAMKKVVNIPVTVKTRTGVDDIDSEEALHHFIYQLIQAGVDHITLHARKGWLKGLSPKENREIPPLEYDKVYRIKQAFPRLSLGINGGVQSLKQAQEHLNHVDEVMIGRAAYHHPSLLGYVDSLIFGETAMPIMPESALATVLPYIESECLQGVPLSQMSRHLLHFFEHRPGARRWRRYLSENAHRKNTDVEVIIEAYKQLQEAADDVNLHN